MKFLKELKRLADRHQSETQVYQNLMQRPIGTTPNDFRALNALETSLLKNIGEIEHDLILCALKIAKEIPND